jgi:hypothetical protein
VPTLTLTLDTAAALGVSGDDLRQVALPAHAMLSLEGLLASRGFDVKRVVYVSELLAGEGLGLVRK